MMIKYRVHEVAKDLEIPNKDVIDVLKDYTGRHQKPYDGTHRGQNWTWCLKALPKK